MEQIRSAAEAYLKSYEATIKLGQNHPHITTQEYGTAIAAHYGPGFTSYTSGHRNTSGSREAETASVKNYLDRLVKSGLGMHFTLDAYHIDVVAANNGGGSALCHATWSIKPLDGREGWAWTNVYAFRLVSAQRIASGDPADSDPDREKYVVAPGYWEFVVSDNELEGLVKRVPTIFTDTFGKE